MKYLPPFVIHGAYNIPDEDTGHFAEQYRKLIINLRDEKYNRDDFLKVEYANELTE